MAHKNGDITLQFYIFITTFSLFSNSISYSI